MRGENRAMDVNMSETGQQRQYNPRPIDTSGITVPDSLTELSDRLAANAHDVWAIGRIRDGWQYGPYRDDNAKQNPCLLDFDQLPAREQEFDRNMVAATIRSIIALGYQIIPKEKSSRPEAGAP
jgi:RyR domain